MEDDPEIAPDDYISSDGGLTWYQSGRCVVLSSDPYIAELLLRTHADMSRYWPNAWIISDHGNAHLTTYMEKDADSLH